MERKQGFLALTTGIRDVMNLQMEDINVWDWAWGLQHQGRFSGATPIMWSVLSHTGLVFELAMRDQGAGRINPIDQVALLVHDASEAYMLDLPRPLKKLEGAAFFTELEDEITTVILSRFGIQRDQVDWDLVKRYDDQALWLEFQKFFPHVVKVNPLFAPEQVYPMDLTAVNLKLAKPSEYVEYLRHLAINLQEVTGISNINSWFTPPAHLDPYLADPVLDSAPESDVIDRDAILSKGLD